METVYPVIFLSLKQVQGFDYRDAEEQMWIQISLEADRYRFLWDSDRLDEVDKESNFTGFNNPKMHTIIDERYDEWFGFTDEEVKEMLCYYGQEDKYALTKEWYDGYLFGKTHVYCPWDVVNWCDKLANTTNIIPENYWANSSGNQMIHRFADKAGGETCEGSDPHRNRFLQETLQGHDSSRIKIVDESYKEKMSRFYSNIII